MKLRIRKVSFIETTGLGIMSYIKVYLFMLRNFFRGEIHDGNSLVIVRDSGGYRGFVSPGALAKSKGVLRKALRENRVLESDNTKKEVEDFFANSHECPNYCPLFKEEKFLGLAYFDFGLDIFAEEIQVLLKHYEWGRDFWKDKILLTGDADDIAEGFQALGSAFSVPVISNHKAVKRYRGKQIIDQKSLRTVNAYIRKMDLKSALDTLKEVDVPVVVCRIPFADEIGELTKDEKLRNELSISGAYVETKDPIVTEQLKNVYGEDYTLWEKGEIACIRQYYACDQGIYKLVDRKGEGTNVVDGRRVTVGVPDEWQNTIYIIGPCTVQGSYVRDEDTIPSYIQRYINKYYPNRYRVVNLGTGGFYEGDYENIAKLTLKKADIMIFVNFFRTGEIDIPQKVKYVDLTGTFLSREGEIFFDLPKHVNAKGCQKVAGAIWEEALQGIVGGLDKTYEERERSHVVKKADYSLAMSDEVKQFVQELQRCKFAASTDRVGAIVMNANPFTAGHKYLIETASAQVEYLYVFVVEEDKSYFRFQDRMNMVERGTSDLKNVRVLPSGRYVLSASTMPEYFTKETRQDIVVCASEDLEIFGMYVAPALGITKRFVGEEPFDKVTCQYNEAMKRILPEYGIELICIERKADQEDRVISASRVRKLLREKRYEEIEKIVPQSTFLYLMEEFAAKEYIENVGQN